MYIYFGHVQFLETQYSYTIVKRYENTISIIQLYNLAIKKKWKNNYTIQFFKVESPTLHNIILQVPPYELSLFKMKKNSNILKKFFDNQKVPFIV